MNNFGQSLFLLAAAIAPLTLLTTASLFRSPGSTLADWQAPPVDGLERVRIAATERVKAADDRSLIAEDPVGFSADKDLPSDVSLPYDVAACLAAAEKAESVDDLGGAEAARRSLTSLVSDRLAAIQAIRPNGGELALDLKKRLDATSRRCVWLSNRELVAREMKSAEDSLAAGPEGDGEAACLTAIKSLRKQLPSIATTDTIAAEPGDALTPGEAVAIDALEARALFRRDFFRARKSAGTESLSARELKKLIAEWDEFLGVYSKKGPPDARDAQLLKEATALRRTSQLEYLRATAKEQSSATDFVRGIVAWLKEATRRPAEVDRERKAATEVVKGWLAERIPPLDALPKSRAGVQEGITSTKRMVGFFVKVNGTDLQYRWWPWDSTETYRQQRDKGDKQVTLKAPGPSPLRHGVFARSYGDSRKALLSGGFASSAGVENFVTACQQLQDEFGGYQGQWDPADGRFPPDVAAKDWGDVFGTGRTIADEFHTAAEKHGLWDVIQRNGDER